MSTQYYTNDAGIEVQKAEATRVHELERRGSQGDTWAHKRRKPGGLYGSPTRYTVKPGQDPIQVMTMALIFDELGEI